MYNNTADSKKSDNLKLKTHKIKNAVPGANFYYFCLWKVCASCILYLHYCLKPYDYFTGQLWQFFPYSHPLNNTLKIDLT